MINNLFLKPQLHLLPFPSKLLFTHTHKPSLLRIKTFSIPNFSAATTTVSYGPSLHKGTNPSQSSHLQNDAVLHEQNFTRVFDLVALRVPSAECFALENRLRGHLLNWPRIRNIARVPGDEIDPNIAPLLEAGKSAEKDDDVLSPVLYRDKLAKTFNTRGYVKFRNLAKISRPSRNRKKKDGEVQKLVEDVGNKRVGRNGFVAVEVVEEGGDVDEGLRNLLGEDFGTGKWRGSTRLLLLDESYADCGLEELPEAIKVYIEKKFVDISYLVSDEINHDQHCSDRQVRLQLKMFYYNLIQVVDESHENLGAWYLKLQRGCRVSVYLINSNKIDSRICKRER